MTRIQQARLCTHSSVSAVAIAHPDTLPGGKPWFPEDFRIGLPSWQAALSSLAYVNPPAAIEIFVPDSQRSGWISPLSHPSVISPGKNCVHCFNSTETHLKKTRGSTNRLLILHTCRDEGGGSLSLMGELTGIWQYNGVLHTFRLQRCSEHWHLVIAFCRGGEGKTKLCFAPDKRISPEYSRKICKGGKKKSTESCTYMNYVSGAFVGLGFCHETVIFRIIRRGRRYVFEGCNNGIMCYGDGHKCLYFPVYTYPRVCIYANLYRLLPGMHFFLLGLLSFPYFCPFPLLLYPFLIPSPQSMFPGLPSCPVTSSSLLSISFPSLLRCTGPSWQM